MTLQHHKSVKSVHHVVITDSRINLRQDGFQLHNVRTNFVKKISQLAQQLKDGTRRRHMYIAVDFLTLLSLRQRSTIKHHNIDIKEDNRPTMNFWDETLQMTCDYEDILSIFGD